MYRSTKTYGHDRGFSVCFRQWNATSHCSNFHGYALAFKFTFEAEHLDKNGWVVDFGGLKDLEYLLRCQYDHTVLLAHDDPYNKFLAEGLKDIAAIRIVENVSIEHTAKYAFKLANNIVKNSFPHARVVSCEVWEHGGNSAIYSEERK